MWLGCTSRRYVTEPVEALRVLFDRIGKRTRIIDDGELCCGSVLYTTGQSNRAGKNRLEVERILRKKNIKEMVLLCPGCMRTFNDFFIPRRKNPLKKVVHYTELLVDNLQKLQLSPPRGGKNQKVTYHDPCHLGKHLGLYEAPRSLLNGITGVDLVEMPQAQNESFCCGSGGGLRAYNKDIADHSSYLRLQEAMSVDAGTLITSCPFCERSFIEAQKEYKEVRKIKINNLAVFISQYI